MFLSKLNVSLFPLCLLALLLYANIRQYKSSRPERLYIALTAFAMLAIVSDILKVLLNGSSHPGSAVLLRIVSTVYSANCFVIPAVWLMYEQASLRSELPLKCRWFFAPSAIGFLLALSTPFTGLFFRIDESAIYRNGGGYWILVALCVLTMVFAFILSVMELLKASSLERRRQCLLFALFSIIPLADMWLGILTREAWALWLFYSIVLLVFHVSVQNVVISSDPLTGLNNRAEFDKYLSRPLAGAARQTASIC